MSKAFALNGTWLYVENEIVSTICTHELIQAERNSKNPINTTQQNNLAL